MRRSIFATILVLSTTVWLAVPLAHAPWDPPSLFELRRGRAGAVRHGGPPSQPWLVASRSDATLAQADLPPGVPPLVVPDPSALTPARIELGRRLFYDARLSVNGTQSCGTCHRPEFAFTDTRARAVGATGQVHPRGSMSLINVASRDTLTWANPNWPRWRSRRSCRCSARTPSSLD